MKIDISVPSHLDRSRINSSNQMDVRNGLSLEGLFRLLNLPVGLMNPNICLVNGKRVELSYRLMEGDKVTFFPVLAGG